MFDHGCFITGTDTGVGKTYVASLIVRARRRQGEDCVGMKPICCGDRADAELLHAANDQVLSLDELNPVWLRLPIAPHAAAQAENRSIDPDHLHAAIRQLRQKHRTVVIEGAGGWLVPIAPHYFVSDLAAAAGLPIVVVAPNRLGTINHTLLTLEAIAARRQFCAGVILNQLLDPAAAKRDSATTTNRMMLESLMNVPILCEVAHGQSAL